MELVIVLLVVAATAIWLAVRGVRELRRTLRGDDGCQAECGGCSHGPRGTPLTPREALLRPGTERTRR
jgi:hypothetical protein